jgi:hypothetical protein
MQVFYRPLSAGGIDQTKCDSCAGRGLFDFFPALDHALDSCEMHYCQNELINHGWRLVDENQPSCNVVDEK